MKNPFASKTIWGIIIMVISWIAGMFNIDLPADQVKETVEHLSVSWPDILEAIHTVTFIGGGIVAIWGRKKAEVPLSFKTPIVPLILASGLIGSMSLLSSCNTIPNVGLEANQSPEGDARGCFRLFGIGPVDLTICADKSEKAPADLEVNSNVIEITK